MSLLEKQEKIVEQLQTLYDRCVAVLTSKHVSLPSNFKLNDTPTYISFIETSDFEFFFRFDNVDQFGTPSYPKRGQSSGGLLYSPTLTLSIPISIDMAESQFPSDGFHMPAGLAQLWGYPGKCIHNITGSYTPTMKDVTLADMGTFRIVAFPEVLAPGSDALQSDVNG